MDVTAFLAGNFLTHVDLPAPSQVWTIRDVKQQLVGTDQKICIHFAEHQKPLGLNKTNLRTIADGYTIRSEGWIGKQLELFKDRTQFQGRVVDCIRVRIPSGPQQPAPPAQQQAQQPQPVAPPQQPAAAPAPAPALADQQAQAPAADPPWTAQEQTQPGQQ